MSTSAYPIIVTKKPTNKWWVSGRHWLVVSPYHTDLNFYSLQDFHLDAKVSPGLKNDGWLPEIKIPS